jgi:Fe-Mn family superoxide dismutase
LITRRQFQTLAAPLLAAAGASLLPGAGTVFANSAETSHKKGDDTMALELPPLPYAYDALGQFMSKETLEYHHDKHHQAYVTNGNNLLKDSPLAGQSLTKIVKAAYKEKNQGLINNVGQHYNHLHFWQWMKKDGGGKKLPAKLQKAIDSDLGGYDKMRADFINAGTTQFGSGWAWIAVKNGKLEIQKTANGENPLMHGSQPILGVDVWEHSYYIDYRNARPKYLEAFVDNLINWEHVEEMFSEA